MTRRSLFALLLPAVARDKDSIMEREWFDYTGDYTIRWSVLSFYDCTLKKQLGRYTVGTPVRMIVIDLNNGEMLLWVHDSNEPPDARFSIGYRLLREKKMA